MCSLDSSRIAAGALLLRRDWLQWAVRGLTGVGLGLRLGNIEAMAQQPKASAAVPKREAASTVAEPAAEPELAEIQKQLVKADIGPLVTVRSAHYVAIGDAAEEFVKEVILGDCEQLTLDYLRHFQSHGFDVRLPERRLVAVIFRDNQSYAKFSRLRSVPSATRKVAGKAVPLLPGGFYDPTTNALYIFDCRRNVAHRAAFRNVQMLSHEGTHQLTFNTGLLNRQGDVPRAIGEGLGTYGEARQIMGPSDLGRLNLMLMEQLAKLQRHMAWIPVRELLTNDAIFLPTHYRRRTLGYAESWLLVHYLMNEQELLPRFRNYLQAIAKRTKPDHRLEDAQTYLGDLDHLDPDLRRYAVRIQLSLR